MRVIAGSARRLQLKAPKGMDTRPTQDRIKETLFNIIQDDIYDSKFLDLFSGSGGIGIEALSRGARHAVFVDKSKAAQACIKENLRHTHLDGKATLISSDVFSSRVAIEREGPYSLIYIDPPYDTGDDVRTLEMLAGSKAVDDETIVIVEMAIRSDENILETAGFEIVRIKEYKTNKHIFLRKNND